MSTTPQTGTSGSAPSRRVTVRDIAGRKVPGSGTEQPVVCITAYTASMARFMDKHVDLLLVGDPRHGGSTGSETTLGVTLDIMIAHGKAVMRGSSQACVIVDMPFGSYQASPAEAFKACAQVMADTRLRRRKARGRVDMEMAGGDRAVSHRARHSGDGPCRLDAAIGASARRLSGRSGRSNAEADKIVADGIAIAEAGAFSLVVE